MSPIAQEFLRQRMPQLGTITVGYGTEATSKKGLTYSQPHRVDTFVFHTDDAAVARAVLDLLGGRISEQSPSWAFDVITDADCLRVEALHQQFDQAMKSYKGGVLQRACDSEWMSVVDGRRDGRSCLCVEENGGDRTAERACNPYTSLSVLLPELDADRFGVFTLKSNSLRTAANLSGWWRLVAAAGGAVAPIPVLLRTEEARMVDRDGTARNVVQITAVPAVSLAALRQGAYAALPGQRPPALQAPEDRALAALRESWATLTVQVTEAGLTEQVRTWWRARGLPGKVEDLAGSDLRDAIEHVRDILDVARSDASGRPEGSGVTTPHAGVPTAESGADSPDSGDDPDVGVIDACGGCGSTSREDAHEACEVCWGWGPAGQPS